MEIPLKTLANQNFQKEIEGEVGEGWWSKKWTCKTP